MRAQESLEDVINQRARRCRCDLFPVVQKPSEDEWRKSLYTVEIAVVLEKNLNQVLWDLRAFGSTCADALLRDFLNNHFLGQEGNLIKNMATTWLTSQAGWPAGGAGPVCFRKAHPRL